MQPDQSVPAPPSTQSPMSTEQVPSPSQPIPTPPVLTEAPKKSFPVLVILIILIILALLGSLGYFGYQNYVSSQQITALDSTPQPTPVVITPTPNPDPTANWVERKFEKLKLTFIAPSELTMEETELSPNQPTASIQNAKIGQEFFQMYFVYQKTGKKVGQSDIQTFKNDPRLIVPGTARDITIDGYNGFAGQVADKRSRFITAIVKNGYWFIIYTAEPTQTNKELSDRIISSFKFIN